MRLARFPFVLAPVVMLIALGGCADTVGLAHGDPGHAPQQTAEVPLLAAAPLVGLCPRRRRLEPPPRLRRIPRFSEPSW